MTAFLALVRKDILLYLHDRRALVLNLVLPILLAAFFGYLVGGTGGPKTSRVDIALVMQDSGDIGRKIAAGLKSDSSLRVTEMTLAQAEGEREAYDAAFDALKSGQYAESARLFQAFLGRYPGGSYAPNALYWLGESYYVTQNYPLAQEQFQALLDRYPTHDKAPGALLKVGLSQYGLQDLDGAERTLEDVVSRYPGSDAARTAADRLGAIQLGRLR